MPANLTPQYQKAEEEYRLAQTAEEQVACLEQMLQLIPKHKGTEKIQADLKTRLKDARIEAQTEKNASKATRSYRIPRQGAGQIVLLGAPNVGKSRLLAELTHAKPEVADYPFTTREVIPGMMEWEDVKVQLIDTPPVTSSHIEPYLLNMVRASDAVLLCFDGSSDDAPEETLDVTNQITERKTRLSDHSGFNEDDFSVVNIKTLMVITHADDSGLQDRLDFFHEMTDLRLPQVRVEFERSDSVENLRTEIFQLLDVIRIYTKKPGKPADKVDPFTIPRGGNVEDLAYKVHRDLAESLKYARVWGESVVDGQSVGRDHLLCDTDVVELHSI